MTLARRLVAEGIGTALLVATVVGSGIMGERLTDDAAVALLANTISTGAILVVLIAILAPVSGGHFNPAVSLVFAMRKKLPWLEAAAYAAVQVGAGILGTMLSHLMFELPLLQLSTHVRTGGSQWLSEGVAAFGLVAVIIGGLRFQKSAVPALVGLYITAAYWFTASTSFANPAVTVARALTDTFSGIRPSDAPSFVMSQLIGAVLGMAAAGWLLRTPTEEATTGTPKPLR